MLLVALLLTQDSVTLLMERWASDRVEERDAATADALDHWEKWKDAELEALEKASKASTTEASARAREALSRIRIRRSLGAKILSLYPDIDRRLVKAPEEERAELLIRTLRAWEDGKLEDAELRSLMTLAAHQDWGISAAEFLKAIELKGCRPAIPFVVAMRSHPTADVRAAAAQLIGTFRVPEQEAHLAGLVADTDPAVQAAAGGALSRLNAVEQAPALLKLVKHQASSVRENALDTLVKLNAPGCADLCEKLLMDPEESVRWRALSGLERRGSARHSTSVLPFLKSGSPGERKSAVGALAALRREDSASDLLPLLEDPDELVRRETVSALARLKGTIARDAVASLMESQDESMCGWAMSNLTQAGAKEYFPRMLKVLETRPDWKGAHRSVRNAVYHFRASEHYGVIAEALDDEEQVPRWSSAKELGKADARKFAPELARRIKTADDDYKAYLIEALAMLGAEEHVDVILDIVRNPAPVHGDAHLALLGLVTEAHKDRLLAMLNAPARHVPWIVADLLVDLDARETMERLHRSAIGAHDEEEGRFWLSVVLPAWGTREHVKEYLPHLDPASRWGAGFAALSLARLLSRLRPEPGDLEITARIEALESRLPRLFRPQVSAALILLGKKAPAEQAQAVSRLREKGYPDRWDAKELCGALLRRHEKEAADRLEHRVTSGVRVDSGAALSDLLAGVNLTLRDPRSVEIYRRLPPGRTRSAHAVVEWCVEYRVIIAEGREIILLKPDEALAYWHRRLSALR
ncbi:MAG TPA: HEAT repeat domain-containing protein [Planctomycetota bacterium]